jgi:hypothetical protein
VPGGRAAAAEEDAELRVLRERAARSRQELGETLEELAGRVRQPHHLARWAGRRAVAALWRPLARTPRYQLAVASVAAGLLVTGLAWQAVRQRQHHKGGRQWLRWTP